MADLQGPEYDKKLKPRGGAIKDRLNYLQKFTPPLGASKESQEKALANMIGYLRMAKREKDPQFAEMTLKKEPIEYVVEPSKEGDERE